MRRMQKTEVLLAFHRRRANEERARAEQAESDRERALHLEMADIFEQRALFLWANW